MFHWLDSFQPNKPLQLLQPFKHHSSRFIPAIATSPIILAIPSVLSNTASHPSPQSTLPFGTFSPIQLSQPFQPFQWKFNHSSQASPANPAIAIGLTTSFLFNLFLPAQPLECSPAILAILTSPAFQATPSNPTSRCQTVGITNWLSSHSVV